MHPTLRRCAGRLPPIMALKLWAMLMLWAMLTPALAADRVESIPTRPGVTQSFWLVEPAGPPRAIAIVILGGDGDLAFDADGPTKQRGNFLMRVRNDLLRAGLLLAYPDTPSDQPNGLGNFRTDPRHAEDIKVMILALKRRADLPVFVIGTSRGTVSAANVAARLDPSLVAGVLLTATVFDRSRNRLHSVHDLPLADIRMPVLELHHKDDGCYITQSAGVPGFMRALANAPRRDSVMLTGGKPAQSDPCEARAAHGFFGVEDQAVKAMTSWIDSVLHGS